MDHAILRFEPTLYRAVRRHREHEPQYRFRSSRMTFEYPPIEDHGLIGNAETVALVDRAGTVAWYPFPHLEAPSVFASVLDADDGGHFRISPAEEFDAEQRYLSRTNVLRTTFETAAGEARVTDFLPPLETDLEVPTRALYRKVECTDGTVDIDVEFSPRHEYGMAETTVHASDGTVTATGGDQRLALSGEIELRPTGDAPDATSTERLEDGETRWLVLTDGSVSPPDIADCDRALEDTATYWREWGHAHDEVEDSDCPFDGPWHDDVVRSGMVLKLLGHAETGAIAAAPTTSLPEEIGGVRNWDYRFSWPRDAAFTVQALAHLGHLDEADAYFKWILDICRDSPGEIRPLYGLHGEAEIEERELDHLEGYRGSRPVRIGNAAVDQRQIDVYGELVLALAVAEHHGWELEADDWPGYRKLVDHVVDVWDQPDSGIWEVRSEPRHFVHSKLMCWLALDRGIETARRRGWEAPIEQWSDTRERIRRTIVERGFDEERNTFTRTLDGDSLDATALLIPIVGFLPFDDERVRGTIEAVRRDLETDVGLVRRYNGEDGLPGDEGRFVLCSFWLVDALALSGHLEEARDLFDNLLSKASPLGLLAEEIEPDGDDGIHRGNFPQAFSHVGLINSALYLGLLSEPTAEGPDPVGIWLGEGDAIPD